MAAGVDSSHTYLFWNITRAGRTPETWFSAAGQAAGQWTAPRKLSLALSAETTAIAGFDAPPLHTAQLAEADGWTARWAAPAAGYGAELPVGLETDEGLAVVWFEQGAPAAYQLVVPEARLIGPPLLLADAQGALTLTWAQPYADRPADLNLTSTQWAAGASRR
jgi:hypothetical protein